ncbi:nucleoside hydrolase [Mycobacterium sp. 1274756.6]|nr:nucleoside hydrolase [Mycobacterium sp. 1274756.6]
MALVYLLASAEADLVGVAATAGNVAVDQVCRNNLDLLAFCGADVPVSRGAQGPLAGPLPTGAAHGASGLGYARLPAAATPLTGHDAATAWVRAAHTHPGRLIGVVTGPLTNLALAVRAEPELPRLLHRLVVMGGAYGRPGEPPAAAEWNLSVDPEAADEVLAAWAPVAPPILCGLELTAQITMTPAHFAQLAEVAGAPTNPLLAVLEDAMRFYFEAHRDRGYGYLAHLHDPLAAAVALDPALIVTRPATVAVELADTERRGVTAVDWSGRCGRAANARIGVQVDPTVFFARFVRRVGEFAARLTYS